MPRTTSFLRSIHKLLSPASHYDRLITVAISRERILHNLALFQKSYPGTPVCPVLKANAYGHGLKEITAILASSESLQKGRIPFLVVDSYHEALLAQKTLKRNGAKRQDVLVIGFTPTTTLKRARATRLVFTITDIDQLRELVAAEQKKHLHRPLRLHIKIDTGMHRQGVAPEEVAEALTLLKASALLRLEGVCSHLAEADSEDHTFTNKQIVIWNTVVKQAKALFGGLHYHLTATAGADHLPKADVTATRLGIGLYGISASTHTLYHTLQPALEMNTVITGVKKLTANESVGYDRTFTALRTMTIATIPVGYYEGLDRRLSNKGSVSIAAPDGSALRCPILGKVSMDITIIDITEAIEKTPVGIAIVAGTHVNVISADPKADNSIRSMAHQADTIPYDILVHIPAGLHREIAE